MYTSLCTIINFDDMIGTQPPNIQLLKSENSKNNSNLIRNKKYNKKIHLYC